jgi:uncharacterized protein (DUF1501 family)
MTYGNAALDKAADHFERIEVIDAGKRCGVQWSPWMGDWFASWSPRNDNSHAEGPWDHWVDLALLILRDPMTAKVRPVAHAAVQGLEPVGFYSESQRRLTAEELAERFRDATA